MALRLAHVREDGDERVQRRKQKVCRGGGGAKQ